MTNSGEPTMEVVDVEGIREYLAQTDVEFAVLFGSYARGTADKSSDVDIALRFSATLSDHDRFHLRNRIDAELQEYADGFVDVSDIESLPTSVAHVALQDGILLVGEDDTVEAYKEQVEAEYEEETGERERENREFIDRLAQGDV